MKKKGDSNGVLDYVIFCVWLFDSGFDEYEHFLLAVTSLFTLLFHLVLHGLKHLRHVEGLHDVCVCPFVDRRQQRSKVLGNL